MATGECEEDDRRGSWREFFALLEDLFSLGRGLWALVTLLWDWVTG